MYVKQIIINHTMYIFKVDIFCNSYKCIYISIKMF